jgi:hypothetical protein
MKLGVLILNSMFLLMFISIIIGEWGKAPAIVASIAIVSLVINSIFILFRTIKDFQELD